MKPRKLKIMGLNSFTGEQTIDFTKLTERGLFGIFGPTGSGKSTILDAITLALYGGKLARDTRDFVNTETGELHVSYEFEIGPKSRRRILTAERYMKRGNRGSYTGSKAKLVESTGGLPRVIAEGVDEVREQITKIIGLNAEDFTRSVVLPQGRFSEFLKLKNQDRRDMLERLFHLERFGTNMFNNLRKYKWDNAKRIENIDGQLKAFQNVSEELYESKKRELKKLKEEERALREENGRLEEEYQKFRSVWDLQQQLNKYLASLEEIKSAAGETDGRREKLKRAKGALLVKPFADAESGTKRRIGNARDALSGIDQSIAELSGRLSDDEESYREAYDRKERQIPELIKKEADLKQALGLDQEIEGLAAQIGELAAQFKEVQNSIDEIVKGIKSLTDGRKAAQDRLDAAEDRIGLIKTDPSLREDVIKAAEVERECAELGGNIRDREERIGNIERGIKQASEEYDRVLKIRDGCGKLISELEEKRRWLLKNRPGDNTLLLKMKDDLQGVQSRLKEALENDRRRGALKDVLSKLAAGRDSLSLKLEELNGRIASQKELLEGINREIEKLKTANIAGVLASGVKDGGPCPVCGSVHHPFLAHSVGTAEIDRKSGQRDEISAEEEGLVRERDELSSTLAGLVRELEVRSGELDDVDGKLSGVDIEGMERTRDKLEAEFASLKEAIDDWEKEKADVEKKLDEAKEAKAGYDRSETALAERINKDREMRRGCCAELDGLNRRFEEISAQYQDYKTRLNIGDAAGELARLNRLAREEDALRGDVESLRVKTDELEKQRQGLDANRNSLEQQRAKIEQSGKEKRAAMDSKMGARNRLSENRDPSRYLTEVKNLTESIRLREAELKRKLDEERERKQKLTEQKSGEEKNLLTLQGLLDEQHVKLIASVDENGFEDADEALSCVVPSADMERLEREIKRYDDDLKYVEDNISGVEERLSGRSIGGEQWRDINDRRLRSGAGLEQKGKLIAAEEKEASTMERDLRRAASLNKQMKQEQHTRDLLGELERLTSGKRFVEFASMSQLRYITVEASKRLTGITNGRYALELDSAGEFVMRDDYNGGVKRSVDTLSGGETFLTSLCLALALSSHIQLKGSAPLEFFFLDEGFGTLDSELLEVVMSSLEKLRSDKFSIGIISHVEELKNRVPVKLIVTPAVMGGGGTKVRIEYS